MNQNPKPITMAKVCSEDENPILHAWFLVKFESESDARWVPLGVHQAIFEQNGSGNVTVTWHMDTWIPEQLCWISALKVRFVDYDDQAILGWEQEVRAYEKIHPKYSLTMFLDRDVSVF